MVYRSCYLLLCNYMLYSLISSCCLTKNNLLILSQKKKKKEFTKLSKSDGNSYIIIYMQRIATPLTFFNKEIT